MVSFLMQKVFNKRVGRSVWSKEKKRQKSKTCGPEGIFRFKNHSSSNDSTVKHQQQQQQLFTSRLSKVIIEQLSSDSEEPSSPLAQEEPEDMLWIPWHKRPSFINQSKPKQDIVDPDAVQRDYPHLLQVAKTQKLHNVNVLHDDMEIG
jgi:hypothetical protein